MSPSRRDVGASTSMQDIHYGFAGPDSGCLDVVRYAAAASEGPVAPLETLQRQWHRKAETSLLS